MPSLPTLLRQYRLRADLTQKALAERIHFSHTVISRTERPNGHYIPSTNYLSTFAKELNLTEEEEAELHVASQGVSTATDLLPTQTRSVQTASSWRKRINVPMVFGLSLVGLLLILYTVMVRLSGSESAQIYRQTAEGDLLYSDTFEDGDMLGWKNLNNGRWDVFEVAGNHALGVRDQDPDAVPNAYLLSSEDWTDYSFSTNMAFESGVYEQIFLVVRSQRQQNCTGYRVGGNRLGVSIFRFDPVNGCDGEVLAEDIHFPLETGRFYRMRVDVVGNRISYYVDDKLILEAQDSKYAKGGVGLLAYQVKSAYFDQVEVRKLMAHE
jgi:transcriptional regulator with XRE-family HTH domain